MKAELLIIRAVACGFGADDPLKQYEPEANRIQAAFYWLEHAQKMSGKPDMVEHEGGDR